MNSGLLALLAVALGIAPAAAQSPSPPLPQTDVPSSLSLDPDAQRRADEIRKGLYKSETIGQGGNLNLDVGKFVTEPDPIERSMPDVQ
ncbi:MAG: hypothetical protein AB7O70_13250, partial [Hyphomicrobiales bacterium]